MLVACNTMVQTARRAIQKRREAGQRIGLVKLKMFRPFPRELLRRTLGRVPRIGVLDRNHSPGSGGIFAQELAASLQGQLRLPPSGLHRGNRRRRRHARSD